MNKETLSLLRDLARQQRASMQAVMENALKEYSEKQFFESVNEAFASLRTNPKRWREELKERKAWEATLADGLGDD